MARDHYPFATNFLDVENNEFTRTSSSFVTSLVAPLARIIQPLAAAWGDLHPDHLVSLRRWAADDYEGPRTLILQRTPAYPETSRVWISALISHLIAITGGGDYENKADCRLSQLTGTKIVLRTQADDARYVSDTLVDSWRYSAPERSRRMSGQTWFGDDTVSWRTQEQALLLPSYLANFGSTTADINGLAIGLDGGNVYRLSWPYENWPVQRPPSIMAEWISALPPRPVSPSNTP